MTGDLSVDGLEDAMAHAVIQQDRPESPSGDQSSGGQERLGAGQDGVVGTDEMDRVGQGPPVDEGRDRRVGGGIAKGQDSESSRDTPPRQPGGRRGTDPAIQDVQEGTRPIPSGTDPVWSRPDR